MSAAPLGGGGRLRLDLHNHTAFSVDGVMSPAELLGRARSRGIHGVGVTDHGSLAGARASLALAAADPSLPRVIPGVEIDTASGEIIGLFVDEDIPGGLSLEETVRRIREQGGVVYLPHPCDGLRRSSMQGDMRRRAASLSDVVEVFNGRSLHPGYDACALALAGAAGALLGAGSDAHYPGEVGRVYLEVSRIPDRQGFCEVLRRARPAPDPSYAAYARSCVYLARTKVGKLRQRVYGQ